MGKEQGLTEISTQMDGLTRQAEKLRGPKALSPAPPPHSLGPDTERPCGSCLHVLESQEGGASLPLTLYPSLPAAWTVTRPP